MPAFNSADYPTLLERRRSLSATVVRDGFECLWDAARARHPRRWSISDKKIEHIIVKAVCGVLNAEGGTLLIRRRRWWRDSRTWQRPPDSRRVGRRRVPGHRSSRAKLGPTLGPSGVPGDDLAVRKLRRVNECVDGYEPGGRRFESCRAHQINNLQPSFFPPYAVVNNLFGTIARAGLGARHLARMATFRPLTTLNGSEHLVEKLVSGLYAATADVRRTERLQSHRRKRSDRTATALLDLRLISGRKQ
jgi:hypothetical protein